VTGALTLEKAVFYNEMTITGKCVLSEDANKKLPARTLVIICTAG
jgi:hypothetical protein